jgi:hypothetical protein
MAGAFLPAAQSAIYAGIVQSFACGEWNRAASQSLFFQDEVRMTLFLQLIGWVLVVVGLPLTLSPVPVGIVIVGIGAGLSLANSAAARNRLRNLRADHRKLDKWLRKAERLLPDPFDRILRSTDSDGWHRQPD